MKSARIPANEAARMASLGALRILDSLPEQEYDDVVQLASAVCGTPIALLSVIDTDRQWVKARLGLEIDEAPRSVSFCAHVVGDDASMLVPDTRKDERFFDHPAVLGEPRVNFYAGAPLRSPEGHAVGTLCVIDHVPRELTPEQLASLEALARQASRLLALRRKTAEAEEATARFRAAFDQNAVGITVLAPDGRFLSVNHAFASMLGYVEGELTGVLVRSLTHPDDLKATDARLASAAPAQRATKRFLHKDGHAVWVDAASRLLTDDQGNPRYWVTQVQDVTARNESEERLRAQYAMAQILAEALVLKEAAPKMLGTLGASELWNVAAIWEVEEAEGVQRCLATRDFGGDETDLCTTLMTIRFVRGQGVVGGAWATGESAWIEDLLAHPDPTVVARSETLRIRSMIAIPVRADGAVVGMVQLISRVHRAFDAPTLRLYEALCTQVGAFLQRKRAGELADRMVALLETTSDFVAMLSGTGRTLYLNGAARAMLEIPPHQDTASVSLNDYVTADTLARVQREIAAVVAARGDRFEGEVVYRSRSGRETPVSQVVVVRSAPDRDELFYAIVARDISEAKKVQRMKNEFLSTVSHELRTPLTSIRGALGLLEGGVVGSIGDEAVEIVKIARANADRLIRLVSDMLDLDKIEAGKLAMFVADASVDAVAASALDSVRGMAQQAEIGLRKEIDTSLCVRVDVDRAVQVLTNLLSNAIKFTPPGGTVTLRVRDASGRVRFEVQDTGPGIKPELRARLFHRFEQLDASDTRAKGGTGLGLAISKAIVEQLGGTIGVESEPDTGTVFWFEVERA